MKLLITGASGLFGSKLAELAAEENHQVHALSNQHSIRSGFPLQLDVTDAAQVNAAFEEIQPDVVVHAAALTDVDKCELNRKLAWKVNVEGTRNVFMSDPSEQYRTLTCTFMGGPQAREKSNLGLRGRLAALGRTGLRGQAALVNGIFRPARNEGRSYFHWDPP